MRTVSGSCCRPGTEGGSWGLTARLVAPWGALPREPHGHPCLPFVDTASLELGVTGGYAHGPFPSVWGAGLCAGWGWGVQQPVLGTPTGLLLLFSPRTLR